MDTTTTGNNSELKKLIDLAELKYSSEDLQAARDIYWLIIDKFKRDPKSGYAQHAYVKLVNILLEQKEKRKFAQALEEGLRFFPNNQWLLIQNARKAQEEENYSEACSRWSLVKQEYPDQRLAYIKEGECYQLLGDFHAAELAFRAGLARLENDPLLLFKLGSILFKRGSFEKTLEKCDLILNSTIEFSPAYTLKGKALIELGRLEQAEELYLKAVKVQPKHRVGYAGLAKLAEGREQFDVALQWWSGVLEQAPNDQEANLQSTKCLIRLGEFRQAKDRFINSQINRNANLTDGRISPKKKNILAIGAYERDNFGDLLFFIVLEKSLEKYNCNLVCSSIIFSDMKDLLGRYVYPYDLLLKNYTWDAVWVVGGEVGGCTLDYALQISIGSLDKNYAKDFVNLHRNMGDAFAANELAYLPDVRSYDLNKNTVFIVNSVGGFIGDANINRIEKACKILTKADVISVRSPSSFDCLNSVGENLTLFPDVVHALSRYHRPIQKDDAKESYFLLQVNSSLLNRYSTEVFAKVMTAVIQRYKIKLYLFAAGTAFKHDDTELYRDLQKAICSLLNKNQVCIIEERSPLALVDWIANASLWIGSSLHGRIISATYSIPRISFSGEKLNEYSKCWDPSFPYNVTIHNLLSQCELALSVSGEKMDDIAKLLADKASQNIECIVQTKLNI